MNIIILGPQGSGKGTQAQMLSDKFDIPHISTGQLFRDNIKNKTALGRETERYTIDGLMVPDEITDKMVKERLMYDDCQNGFILDGYPRNLDQVKFLDTYTHIDVVLDVEISEHESVERLSGRRVCKDCGQNFHIHFKKPNREGLCDACGGALVQREDDTPEAILKRLEIYHKETEPVKEYYKQKELVKVINGSQPIEIVFSEILFNLPKEISEEE